MYSTQPSNRSGRPFFQSKFSSSCTAYYGNTEMLITLKITYTYLKCLESLRYVYSGKYDYSAV